MTFIGVISDLASFGAAGLMGAMWLWERRLSRVREAQLSDAHQRIIRDEQRLGKLTDVVQRNSETIARFTETQRQVVEAIRDLTKELHHDTTR